MYIYQFMYIYLCIYIYTYIYHTSAARMGKVRKQQQEVKKREARLSRRQNRTKIELLRLVWLKTPQRFFKVCVEEDHQLGSKFSQVSSVDILYSNLKTSQ